MLEQKLELISHHARNGILKIMLIGLGSVGNYLLNYLLSTSDDQMEIIVVGRNREKMECDINIARISSLIRRQNRTKITLEANVDLENIDSIVTCLDQYQPDIIVNTSRVYAGLKYGTISWKNVRAYGIWSPLSIKYIRNIMLAYEKAGCHGIVINTSYSDVTIPWLKNSGKAYPDFGSGNFNHLLPRIKFAVSEKYGIKDFWNIEVDMATSHFHDVVISKEGQNEGIEQLLWIEYQGRKLDIDQNDIFSKSQISMPVDSKRNMMNASSNFDIIECILRAIRNHTKERFYAPGAFGEIGGYPVIIDGINEKPVSYIDESHFSMKEMKEKNRLSIALDGIEDIKEGYLIYTDSLIAKTKKAFDVTLPKMVHFDEIDEISQFIIDKIILPFQAQLS